MKKWLALVLLCALPLQGGITSGVQKAAVGGGNIEDDFSGTLAKWTKLDGATATIVSGLFQTNGTGSWIYTDEQTATISQWVLFQYVEYASPPDYPGAYFRSTNNSSAYAYCLRVTNSRTLYWRYCQGSSCNNIDESTGHSVDNNDYIGLEVTGTGTGTVVKVWDFGGSPPADRASWGTATDTLTKGSSTGDANTGKYVGLYDGNAGTDTMDNFSAGDI